MKKIKNFLKEFKLLRDLNRKIKAPIYRWRMKKKGYETLYNVIDNIPQNYNPFVDFGTLLGFIRDGGFISHDIDTDLGIICNDSLARTQLLEKFKQEGYFITHEFYLLNELQEFSLEQDGIKTDIIFYGSKEESGRSLMYTYSFERNFDTVYANAFELDTYYYEYPLITEFTTTSVANFDFPIPSDYEKALMERYGKGWKVKDPNWEYKHDPSVKKVETKGLHLNHKRKNYTGDAPNIFDI